MRGLPGLRLVKNEDRVKAGSEEPQVVILAAVIVLDVLGAGVVDSFLLVVPCSL